MSGREEKPVVLTPTASPSVFPICTGCGSKVWYRSFEAWEDSFLEEDEHDIFQYTGDGIHYGVNHTPWKCAQCNNEPDETTKQQLDIQTNNAEWL